MEPMSGAVNPGRAKEDLRERLARKRQPAGALSGPDRDSGIRLTQEPGTDKSELKEAYINRLCGLLDAYDTFGRYASLPAEDKIDRLFLVSADEKRRSDTGCMVSPRTVRQAALLFQAAAGLLEERSGLRMQSAAELNDEGFGRALIFTGRTILVLKSIRPGFPFPFAGVRAAVDYGAGCAEEGLAFLDQHKRWVTLHESLAMEG